MLEGEEKCRLQRIIPRKPVPERDCVQCPETRRWPLPSNTRFYYVHVFGDFRWRRHVTIPSKISRYPLCRSFSFHIFWEWCPTAVFSVLWSDNVAWNCSSGSAASVASKGCIVEINGIIAAWNSCFVKIKGRIAAWNSCIVKIDSRIAEWNSCIVKIDSRIAELNSCIVKINGIIVAWNSFIGCIPGGRIREWKRLFFGGQKCGVERLHWKRQNPVKCLQKWGVNLMNFKRQKCPVKYCTVFQTAVIWREKAVLQTA